MEDDEALIFLQSNIKYIIKLQAWARGHKARQKVSFMKSKQLGSSKYFTFLEYQETEHQPDKEFVFKTGAIYKGEWLNGKRHGYGVQTWPDGARYEGNWKDHKTQGIGKFYHADGDIYEGEWNNDKANGYGVYTHLDGAKYQG